MRFYDLISQTYRTSEAILHFSSRSVIVEILKDNNQPLYKYLLRNFAKEPSFDQSFQKGADKNALPMKAYSKRIVEVPIQSKVPKPYVQHEAAQTQNLDTESFELSINIEFHEVKEFFNSLRDVYFLYQQKGNSYEDNLDAFIF